LDEAKSTLNVLKLKPEERAKYEREVENQRYKESLLYTAEVKGLKRGREEGKLETQIEIAKNALSEGVDIKTIELITGLSRDEIEKFI